MWEPTSARTHLVSLDRTCYQSSLLTRLRDSERPRSCHSTHPPHVQAPSGRKGRRRSCFCARQGPIWRSLARGDESMFVHEMLILVLHEYTSEALLPVRTLVCSGNELAIY